MRGRLWVATVFAVVSTLGFALPIPASAGGTAPVPPARAYILVDADSGAVLAAQAHHEALPPASTTKLMTALVAVEKLPAEAVLVVGDSAAAQPAMRIGMQSGQGWALSPALHSLLMVSANDAAYALAEAASGSLGGFAADMNATAARYSMRDSVFNDPAGFDDSASFKGGSRVSAYDLAVAARNFLAVPELAEIAALPEYGFQGPSGRQHRLRNHNKLLARYPGAIGLKTGYTRQAGHTFVGAARRDGRTMIAVVLDTDDTYGSAAALMDFGFATAKDDPGIGEQVPPPTVRPFEPPIATTLVQSSEKAVEGSAGGGRWLSRLTLGLFASTGGGVASGAGHSSAGGRGPNAAGRSPTPAGGSTSASATRRDGTPGAGWRCPGPTSCCRPLRTKGTKTSCVGKPFSHQGFHASGGGYIRTIVNSPGLGDGLPPYKEVGYMGIGVSIFLLAVGAILAFAVDVTTEGVNLDTVGVILMIVGGIGLLFSLLFWSSFSPYRREERVVTRERELI